MLMAERFHGKALTIPKPRSPSALSLPGKPSEEHKMGWLNYPAAGNAGIAPQLTIRHQIPGVPEPGCSAT